MPRVLLLLPTTTYRAGDFLEAAKGLGVEVVVASERPNVFQEAQPPLPLPGFLQSRQGRAPGHRLRRDAPVRRGRWD
ncbi:MAG: hypothetical protein ACREJ6_05360 [Candidatus Methylomirabilis sp.]